MAQRGAPDGDSTQLEHIVTETPAHLQLRRKKKNKGLVTRCCTCRPETKRIFWKSVGTMLMAKALKQSDHEVDCPHRRSGRLSYDLHTQIGYCGQFSGFRINASIAYAKSFGRLSISPVLNFTPVVSDSSPAFAVLRYAQSIIDCRILYEQDAVRYRCDTFPEACVILQQVSSQVLQSIQDGLASPHDTLLDGTTILEV
jgi:hypothetical protein